MQATRRMFSLGDRKNRIIIIHTSTYYVFLDIIRRFKKSNIFMKEKQFVISLSLSLSLICANTA